MKVRWMKHNEELNDLYPSSNIARVIKSRRMRWGGHVVRMGEERVVYRVLVGKPEGKRPLGRPRRRFVDNIRTDLQEVGCGYMDWIGLAQDRDGWRRLLSFRPSVRPSARPPDRPPVRPSACPSVRLSVRLSVCLSVRPSVHPSVCPHILTRLQLYRFLLNLISQAFWRSHHKRLLASPCPSVRLRLST